MLLGGLVGLALPAPESVFPKIRKRKLGPVIYAYIYTLSFPYGIMYANGSVCCGCLGRNGLGLAVEYDDDSDADDDAYDDDGDYDDDDDDDGGDVDCDDGDDDKDCDKDDADDDGDDDDGDDDNDGDDDAEDDADESL